MLKKDLSDLIAAKAGLDAEASYVEYPRDLSHGDYASPIALKLAKQEGRNPREVAEELLGKLESLGSDYELEIAGPGFVNFKLKDQALLSELNKVLSGTQTYRLPEPATSRPVICEYSSPNVAKPLGAHHLLGTVIGQAISNIYEYLGYTVIRISHVGDWGSQFGKLIYAYKQWGDHDVIEKDPIAELLKLYVKFHDELEQDESLADLGRAEFKKLEDGDSENREIWEWVVKISQAEVAETYAQLGGIHFDYQTGESFYEEMMEPLVAEGVRDGVLTEGKGGAIVAEFEEEGYPTSILKRSDGATVYMTRDLATAQYRINAYDPDRILYINDVAQKLHFQQVFSIVDRLPSVPTEKSELINVIYGRMRFADKKMSTRKGNILLLKEVLDEAISRAKAVVDEKNPDLADSERTDIASMAGAGGVKYAILAQSRHNDIVFSWDKVVNLDGNSAVYLQYTYARARSVLREAGEPGNFKLADYAEALTDHERELLRKIPRFPEAVVLAAEEYKPHFVTEYLFGLAQSFNGFYANDPILKAEGSQRELRLAICQAITLIIRDGLHLLAGIEVPERM